MPAEIFDEYYKADATAPAGDDGGEAEGDGGDEPKGEDDLLS